MLTEPFVLTVSQYTQITEQLCCTPETNILLYFNDISFYLKKYNPQNFNSVKV